MLTFKFKLAFLDHVIARKDILFAKFSSHVTRRTKSDAWDEISNAMLELGAEEEDVSDIVDLRDKIWPNLKKTTLSKVATAKRKTAEGGKGGKLTEVDHRVLAILNSTPHTDSQDSDSEAADSVRVPGGDIDPSLAIASHSDAMSIHEPLVQSDEPNEVYKVEEGPIKLAALCLNKAEKRPRDSPSTSQDVSIDPESELQVWQVKKIRLECRLLELQIQKMEMEIAEQKDFRW